MKDAPSTGSFLFRAASGALIFILAWMVIEAIWSPRRETLAPKIVAGCSFAVVDMARRYRLPAWRKAVAPVHAFGAAAADLAILLAAFVRTPDPWPASIWWRVGAVVLLGVAPAYVMVLSARELWRRRTDG